MTVDVVSAGFPQAGLVPPAAPAQADPRARLVARLVRGTSLDDLARELAVAPERILNGARGWIHDVDPAGAARIDSAWRDQLADYALGVQSGEEAEMSRGQIERFEDARLWVATVQDHIAALSTRTAVRADAPRLRACIAIESVGANGFVVHDRSASSYFRVQAAPCALLRALDGTRSVAELEAAFAERLPSGSVGPLIERFRTLGLLEGSERPADAATRQRRFRSDDLTSLRFTIVDPDRLLDRALPVIRVLMRPATAVGSGVLIVLGLVTLVVALDAGALTNARWHDPLLLATVAVAVLLTTMTHELAHAAAVKHYGGRVHKLGVMLFYLVPSMFCDTSDAWRFPRRTQRAAVAAAGIWWEASVASLTALLLWLPLGAWGQAWVGLFVIGTLGMCAWNAFPFVKLDGYWILASLVDVPRLREKSRAYVTIRVARLLFGPAPPVPAVRYAPLLVTLGIGSMLCGPLLVVFALLRYQSLLLRLGIAGAVIWLTVALVVVSKPLARFTANAKAARVLPRPAKLRAGAVVAGIAALAIAALVFLPVGLAAHGTYELLGGRVVAHVAGARVGDRVELKGASVFARTLHASLVRRIGHDTYLVRETTGAEAHVSAGTWLWHTYGHPLMTTLGVG